MCKKSDGKSGRQFPAKGHRDKNRVSGLRFFPFILNKVKSFVHDVDIIHRKKAIDDLEWEVQELKHVFALLTVGSFVGMPVAPLPVTLELLPDIRVELSIMLLKIRTAQNPLSEQFSKFDAV